jgi:HEAT repeat protein
MAEFGDRHDAAMDLGEYDEPEAEEALLQIVLADDQDEDLADAAGESLWQIWGRKGKHDIDLAARMHPEARKFFESK